MTFLRLIAPRSVALACLQFLKENILPKKILEIKLGDCRSLLIAVHEHVSILMFALCSNAATINARSPALQGLWFQNNLQTRDVPRNRSQKGYQNRAAKTQLFFLCRQVEARTSISERVNVAEAAP